MVNAIPQKRDAEETLTFSSVRNPANEAIGNATLRQSDQFTVSGSLFFSADDIGLWGTSILDPTMKDVERFELPSGWPYRNTLETPLPQERTASSHGGSTKLSDRLKAYWD